MLSDAYSMLILHADLVLLLADDSASWHLQVVELAAASADAVPLPLPHALSVSVPPTDHARLSFSSLSLPFH